MSSRQHKETTIARRIRARGLAAGRSLALIAEEIHQICGPQFGTTRIKAHRLANGIALMDVIEQVRALFERDGKSVPGIGETLLSAYESGVKRPGPEYLHYLCLVYRVNPLALGIDGQCICGRSHTIDEISGAPQEEQFTICSGSCDRPCSPCGNGQAPSRDEEDEDVLRRTLLRLLAGGAGTAGAAGLNSQVLGAVESVRRRMDEAMAAATVSPAMIDQWEQMTTGFGRQYMNTPPLRLLCDVLLEFSAVRKALEQRQPPDVQDRLCRMASRLAGLSGMIMINLGDHRMARSFFRTSRTAADETGDRPLRAWVAAREALVPLYYGNPREALTLARMSKQLAGTTPCAARTMAPVVEARALALMAQGHRPRAVVNEARRALDQACSAFAELKASDQEDPAFGYTERQLFFHQGTALVRLGEPSKADVFLRRALEKYLAYDEHLLDQTLIRFDRALCRLMEGDVDAALAMGREAIEAVGEDFCNLMLRPGYDLAKAVHAEYGDIPPLVEFRELLASRSVVTNPSQEVV